MRTLFSFRLVLLLFSVLFSLLFLHGARPIPSFLYPFTRSPPHACPPASTWVPRPPRLWPHTAVFPVLLFLPVWPVQ